MSFAQGRNRFHGPRYFSADLTIMKNTRLPGWENQQFGLGLQFFNVFNHPNFGMPDGFSSASSLVKSFIPRVRQPVSMGEAYRRE